MILHHRPRHRHRRSHSHSHCRFRHWTWRSRNRERSSGRGRKGTGSESDGECESEICVGDLNLNFWKEIRRRRLLSRGWKTSLGTSRRGALIGLWRDDDWIRGLSGRGSVATEQNEAKNHNLHSPLPPAHSGTLKVLPSRFPSQESSHL